MSEDLLIIVHPGSPLTGDGGRGYWTEVPALPACAEIGATPEEALARTEAEIQAWTAAVQADRESGRWQRRIEYAL